MSGSALLVPLYVYPFEGAWQPLYDAIAAHPHAQFLVVVNPYNGPGPDALPDANYCREIPKLRSHSNVAVFGYVHVQWAQRQLDTVLQDVETYAAWPKQQNHPHQPLQVDGIFVDETPFAGDAPTLDFLGSLTSMVHRNWPSNDTSGDTPAAWIPVGGTARTPTVSYTLSHGATIPHLTRRFVSFDYCSPCLVIYQVCSCVRKHNHLHHRCSATLHQVLSRLRRRTFASDTLQTLSRVAACRISSMSLYVRQWSLESLITVLNRISAIRLRHDTCAM
jgi:hypothetical protein